MKYIPIIIVTIALLGTVFFQVLHYLESKKNDHRDEGEDVLKKSKWQLRSGKKEDQSE